MAIQLTYRSDALGITVEDDGSGSGSFGGSGSGLAGMRERARTLGGTFDAGRVGGGFQVACQLPVESR